MVAVYVNMNSDETPANTTVQWNNAGGSESGLALVDSTNSATTWTLDSNTPIFNNGQTNAITTTGDAAWVDEQAVIQDGAYATSTTTYETITVNVPNDAQTYDIEIFGTTEFGTSRTVQARINGGTAQTLNTSNNTSNTITFANVANNAGVLLIEFRRDTGITGNAFVTAFRVTETVPTPTLSIDGDLEPGGAFTLTYSDYVGVPTSPITITDAQGNTDTVAVTVSDNGDGSGTASGTMPALPSSGSEQSVLFGAVTVELST